MLIITISAEHVKGHENTEADQEYQFGMDAGS